MECRRGPISAHSSISGSDALIVPIGFSYMIGPEGKTARRLVGPQLGHSWISGDFSERFAPLDFIPLRLAMSHDT